MDSSVDWRVGSTQASAADVLHCHLLYLSLSDMLPYDHGALRVVRHRPLEQKQRRRSSRSLPPRRRRFIRKNAEGVSRHGARALLAFRRGCADGHLPDTAGAAVVLRVRPVSIRNY